MKQLQIDLVSVITCLEISQAFLVFYFTCMYNEGKFTVINNVQLCTMKRLATVAGCRTTSVSILILGEQ